MKNQKDSIRKSTFYAEKEERMSKLYYKREVQFFLKLKAIFNLTNQLKLIASPLHRSTLYNNMEMFLEIIELKNNELIHLVHDLNYFL